MNRLPSPTQGRRDIIAIVLLVVPLIAIGYYLAVIEVAVDPPPDPADTSTPTIVSTTRADTIEPSVPSGSSSPETIPATPGAGPAARSTTHGGGRSTPGDTVDTF